MIHRQKRAVDETTTDEQVDVILSRPQARRKEDPSDMQSLVVATGSDFQPFKCRQCKKKFRDLSSIHRHIKMDHLQLAKKCQRCDFEGLDEDFEKHENSCLRSVAISTEQVRQPSSNGSSPGHQKQRKQSPSPQRPSLENVPSKRQRSTTSDSWKEKDSFDEK